MGYRTGSKKVSKKEGNKKKNTLLMIKKIIHVADIHIRLYKRMDECNAMLYKFVSSVKKNCEGYSSDEIRIVIAGDLVHQYNTVSNEMLSTACKLIRELEKIGKVIVISGNHDMEEVDSKRKDTITTIFDIGEFENAIFAEQELGYKSGCIVDDNVIWCLYSRWDWFSTPDIDIVSSKPENAGKWRIGLFHGMVVGGTMQNGTIIEEGISQDELSKCDAVMMGHVHKRQEIIANGVDLVYPGSLIQQDMGETVSGHGYAIWEIEGTPDDGKDLCPTFVDLDNDYAIYKFEIDGLDTVNECEEKLCNY